MATVDAEEARQVCSKALLKLATGQQDAAVELLAAFGTRCWRLAQGEMMAEEVGDLRADRLDLAALRVNLGDSAPEQDDDF